MIWKVDNVQLIILNEFRFNVDSDKHWFKFQIIRILKDKYLLVCSEYDYLSISNTKSFLNFNSLFLINWRPSSLNELTADLT